MLDATIHMIIHFISFHCYNTQHTRTVNSIAHNIVSRDMLLAWITLRLFFSIENVETEEIINVRQ